jgi:hypothetical protein
MVITDTECLGVETDRIVVPSDIISLCAKKTADDIGNLRIIHAGLTMKLKVPAVSDVTCTYS